MANLSNINNKLIVTDGGQVLVNQTAAGFNADADDLIVGNLLGNTGITIASGSNVGDYGSIYFADGTGSGTPSKAGYIRYEQNTSKMTIGINAVEKVAIDVSGNVGIGVTPTEKLTVEGTARIQTNANYYSDRTYLGDTWEFASDTTDGVTFSITGGLAATAGNYFRWLTQEGAATPIERMRITSAGNVGIGTSSPPSDHILQIHNAGAAYARFALTNTSTGVASADGLIFQMETLNSIIKNQEAGYLTFGTSGRETDLRIDSAGNVGIGTTSPVSKLSINSNGIPIFAAAAMATTGLTVHNSTGGTAIQIGTYDAGSYNYIQSGYVNSASVARELRFYSGATQQMTLFADGDVSIGMTANHAMLNVNGIVRAENSSFLAGRETAGAPAFAFHDDADTGMFNVASNILCFSTAGSERMRIRSDGGIAIGAGNTGYASQILSVKSGTADTVFYGESTDANCFASFRDNSSTANIEFGAIGNAHVFRNDTTEKMRITSAGNVGINYTTPFNQISGTETTLAVSNSNAASLYLNNTAAGGHNHILFSGTGGALSFYDKDRADYNMVIDSSGNVGIGTTSPSYLLHVDDSVATDPSYIVASSGSDFIMAMGSQSSPGVAQEAFIGTLSNQRFKLKVNNAEIATLTSGGLGIGMTTPTASLGIQANYTANGSYTTDGWARYLVLDAANTGGGGIIWTKQSSTYNRAILNNQGKMEFGRSTANDASAAWLSDLSIDAVGDSTFGGNIFIASTSDGIFLGGTSTSNVLKKFVGNQAGGGAVWTPTVTTSQLTNPTITSSSGYYQQVGNVVTASFEFTMSNPAVGAGAVIINNLPIAIADTDHVSGCGVISALGKTINVFHYTATNQIAMYTYDGNYCGTTHRTVGTVTYWAAT